MRILIITALASIASLTEAAAECEPAGITDKGEGGCNGFRYRRVDHRLGPWEYTGLKPGTKEWKLVKIGGPTPLEDHDLCDNAPAVTATLELTHTGTDSTGYTLEGGIEISTEAKAGINIGIEAELGIKASATFKAGTSTTSTVSNEVKRTWQATFPTNTHWEVSGEAWGWEEKTVILGFRRSKQQRSYCCRSNDNTCWAGDGDNADAPYRHCDYVSPTEITTSPGNKKLMWMAKSKWRRVKQCPCPAPAPKQAEDKAFAGDLEVVAPDPVPAPECPIEPPLPPDELIDGEVVVGEPTEL